MVDIVWSGGGVTVKDDEGKELEGYFCPFAGERCYEGEVIPEKSSAPFKGKCRFWSSGRPGRCSFQPALEGLAAISAIPGMLQSLASKGKG